MSVPRKLSALEKRRTLSEVKLVTKNDSSISSSRSNTFSGAFADSSVDNSVTEIRPIHVSIQTEVSQENSRCRRAVVFILCSHLLMSCGFHTVMYSFIPIANNEPYAWSTSKSVDVLTVVYITLYLSAFCSSWASDTHIARFKTICLGYLGYLLGYAIIIASQSVLDYGPLDCSIESYVHHGPSRDNSSAEFEKDCSPILISSLIVIGLGSGVLFGNVIIFGADQVKSTDSVPKFFHMFFWVFKVGALISCYVINYAEVTHTDDQLWPLVTGMGCLVLSGLVFILGKRNYVYRERQTDMAKTLTRVITSSLSDGTNKKIRDREASLSTSVWGSRSEKISRLDLVMLDYGGQFRRDVVECVKRLLRLCLLFSSLVPFYFLSIQFTTLYRVQGIHLKLPNWALQPNNGTLVIKYPVTWFSTGVDLCTVVVLVPLIFLINSDLFHDAKWSVKSVCCRGALYHQPRLFTKQIVSSRLTMGFLAAGLSVTLAGCVDAWRVYLYHRCTTGQTPVEGPCSVTQRINGVDYEASDLSMLWQMPQFVLAGFSEIMVVVTAHQFAYLEAPDQHHHQYRMQGVFIGLTFLAQLFGALLAMAGGKVIGALDDFCSGSFEETGCTADQGKLYWYFYLLGAVQLGGALCNKYCMLDYLRWDSTGSGFCF